MVSEKEGELFPEDEEEELGELAKGKFGGKCSYMITMDAPQASVEANYFGLLSLLERKFPFGSTYDGVKGHIEKIKDIYMASETSAYFGMVEQRKGAQQDKFQQIMANIGQMVKTLFQLLRELRIIDERLEYYDKSMAGDKAAEVALKGIWTDMVEGGAKSPGSVLGLAAQVGFVTLPDLFFSTHPKSADDVEKAVIKWKKGGFNRKVREVLMRKLKQYMTWKEKTYKELKTGQVFKLKYMRQHYHVIKAYLNWMRPYLRNIKRLQMKSAETDKDVMAAFDTSKIELEILAIKHFYTTDMHPDANVEYKFKKQFPCIRVRIEFVAMPQMSFQQEGFQRGALHVGKTKVYIEGFVTDKEQLDKYKKSIEDEDFELLAAVNESITALKDDLEYYLEKAGDLKKEEKEVEEVRPGILSPFKSLIDGAKEIFGLPVESKSTLFGGSKNLIPGEAGAAAGIAKNEAYILYKIFKKQNRMFTE